MKNIELAKVYYPNWVTRFYVNDVPAHIYDKIRSMGAEIVNVDKQSPMHRFYVAADPSVDRYIVRDIDSRLNAREAFAVEEWIRSGGLSHIYRTWETCEPWLNSILTKNES